MDGKNPTDNVKFCWFKPSVELQLSSHDRNNFVIYVTIFT